MRSFHPVPRAMPVWVPDPVVIEEMLMAFRVPEAMPALWMSTPLLVMVAAAPAVMVLILAPSKVQAPEAQPVIEGAVTLMPLMALVPAPLVLTVGAMFNPLVIELPEALVDESEKVRLDKLPVSAAVWM